jgi:outer membrane protein assembly factor BamB
VFSTPAVAGDLVYIGSCAGSFLALERSTGLIRWSYDIRNDGNQQSFHGNPLFVGDLVLIGTDKGCAPDAIGHVYAFDKTTGSVRWKYRTTSASTDIIRIGPRVYFGSVKGDWTALNLNDGSPAWSFSTGTPECDFPKAPVADDHHVYVTGLDGQIYAIDAESGRIVWKRKLLAAPSTSLLLKDRFLIVGAANNHIYRLNSESGATDAEITVEATPVGRPAWSENSLIVFLENRAERSGFIVAMDSDFERIRWTQKSSPEWATDGPHVTRDLVIAGNCRGELAAFRVSDGAQRWRLKLKGCIRSVGDSADLFFAGVQEGTVYALRQ